MVEWAELEKRATDCSRLQVAEVEVIGHAALQLIDHSGDILPSSELQKLWAGQTSGCQDVCHEGKRTCCTKARSSLAQRKSKLKR